MAKTLNKWLDEFVENGASPNRVTEWPDEAGGGGTTVVANPTLAGTEANLTGLQVGDTKYKVPEGGGTALYKHNINIRDNEYESSATKSANIFILSSSDTPFTKETLYQHFKEHNLKTISEYYSANGYFNNNICYGIHIDDEDENEFYFMYIYLNGTGHGHDYININNLYLTDTIE